MKLKISSAAAESNNSHQVNKAILIVDIRYKHNKTNTINGSVFCDTVIFGQIKQTCTARIKKSCDNQII